MNWGRSSRLGAASPTDCQCRSRFVLYQMACGEKQALHQREDSTVRLTIVDGSTHDECIRSRHLLSDDSAEIIVEHATLAAGLMTTTTVDAHADGAPSNLNDFSFDAVLLQRRFYLLQTAKRISIGSWAAVDQKYFALFASHRIYHS